MLAQQVAQFWAQPSHNLKTPPLHSTGAAVDITLVNEKGETIDFGGEIDEISERSFPDFYQNRTTPSEQLYQQRRELLKQLWSLLDFANIPKKSGIFPLAIRLG